MTAVALTDNILFTASRSGKTESWANQLARAQAGDRIAYNHFLQAVLPWLEQQATRFVPAPLADDLVQDSLLAIHRVLHTFDASRGAEAWLYGIMRYKAKESWRRQSSRFKETSLDDAVEPEAPAHDTSAAGDIKTLLATLPDDQATIIRLTKLQGLSVEEAALATGRSVAWVKVNVHRGLKQLQSFVRGGDHA